MQWVEGEWKCQCKQITYSQKWEQLKITKMSTSVIYQDRGHVVHSLRVLLKTRFYHPAWIPYCLTFSEKKVKHQNVDLHCWSNGVRAQNTPKMLEVVNSYVCKKDSALWAVSGLNSKFSVNQIWIPTHCETILHIFITGALRLCLYLACKSRS